MRLSRVVRAASEVADTAARNEKVGILADLLTDVPDDELTIVVAALCGAPRQGRIGVGWATARIDGRATGASLDIADLDRLVDDLASAAGAGVQSVRSRLLAEFGERATPEEAAFVVRLLTGELRHGALAGVVEQAVARSEAVPVALVRRAAMLSGDLPATAALARTGGREGLEGVGLRLGVPVSPMLASTSESVAAAVEGIGDASVEWKLDGIRLQAHVRRDRVRLFTRNLNDVTGSFPSVVSSLAALALPSAVLDGEVIGGEAHWFDVLHLAGTDLIDEALSVRLDALESVERLRRIPGVRTSDATAGDAVLAESLGEGHEGVVVKDLGSPYAAGRRGKAWLKVKPVHTLDLVVIAVEWGSGRRRGLLSNLHLAAIGDDGGPVMVGKTFKGLTDEMLAWQTEQLLAREVNSEGHVVHVRPDLVVEVAVDGVHRSTRYPGGVALRFARVRRYRPDKPAHEADRLTAVRGLLP